jgi:itaconyl-CoA hydratase
LTNPLPATDPDDLVARIEQRAVLLEKGNYFDDFEVGHELAHHWGRTVTQSDNLVFNSLTLNYNPLYLNADYARDRGHPREVINPYLVFLVVFGLSVEDLSEKGGAFLGVENLVFHRHAYDGDTVYARSTVTALRPSGSRPDHGIATWHTVATTRDGDVFLEFTRTNLIPRRPGLVAAHAGVGSW